MKIEFYLVPEDAHGKAIKLFLDNNRIPYKEIVTNNINLLKKIARVNLNKKYLLSK